MFYQHALLAGYLLGYSFFHLVYQSIFTNYLTLRSINFLGLWCCCLVFVFFFEIMLLSFHYFLTEFFYESNNLLALKTGYYHLEACFTFQPLSVLRGLHLSTLLITLQEELDSKAEFLLHSMVIKIFCFELSVRIFCSPPLNAQFIC